MLYALQTIPGLANLAWQEAEQALPAPEGKPGPRLVGVRHLPGRDDIVLIDHAGGPRPLLRLRSSEDVFAVAARAFRVAPDDRGLRQIYAAVRHSEHVGDALEAWRKVSGERRQGLSFRVVVREVGKHKFMRRDIGKAVADAVRDGWPGKWTRVDEGADVEIWATLAESELVCAVRLSDAEMRQRGKLRHLPASLRPALAAAMVMLTRPAASDVFVDPMAGAGTILLERAAVGPFAEIHGGDINGEALAAMQANLRGVKGEIMLSRWDARKLPFEDGEVDKIAVNLPFGKQVSDKAALPGLYHDLLIEFARVLRSGGRLVLLVGDVRVLEQARAQATRAFRAGPRHRVFVLGQPATIGEYVRN